MPDSPPLQVVYLVEETSGYQNLSATAVFEQTYSVNCVQNEAWQKHLQTLYLTQKKMTYKLPDKEGAVISAQKRKLSKWFVLGEQEMTKRHVRYLQDHLTHHLKHKASVLRSHTSMGQEGPDTVSTWHCLHGTSNSFCRHAISNSLEVMGVRL